MTNRKIDLKLNTGRGLAVLAVGMVWVGQCMGATVQLGEDEYTVTEGETLVIPSSLMLEVGEDDLFSYGVALLVDGGDPSLVMFEGATVPGALDFNGPAGTGALTMVALGFSGIKGTVDSSQNPLVGYSGPEFAEFRVSFAVPGTYTLRTDFFNTLGPTEAIFVTTSGMVLDGGMVFDTVTVTVVPVPEVGVVVYLMVGGLLLGRRRR